MSCGNEFHMWCSFFQFSLNQFWMLWGFVFTSSARFGTLGPFLQSPFIWHRVLFQNIIVIYIQGIFMDHVLVSQRYLGTTMRNHLVSRTDVGKKDMKDWYQKLCEMTWNSNHHGSDIKTLPERFKPFSCTQHVFFSPDEKVSLSLWHRVSKLHIKKDCCWFRLIFLASIGLTSWY